MTTTLGDLTLDGMSTCCSAKVYAHGICGACREHCGVEPGVPDHDDFDCDPDTCTHPIHGEKEEVIDDVL